jgi:hypothetical protein
MISGAMRPFLTQNIVTGAAGGRTCYIHNRATNFNAALDTLAHRENGIPESVLAPGAFACPSLGGNALLLSLNVRGRW